MNETTNEKKMGFLDHLDELRIRLIICLAALLLTTAGCYFFSIDALKFIAKMTDAKIQVLGPLDAFMIRLKVSVVMGLAAASPVVFTEIWLFVAPALKKNEKKYAIPLIVSAVLLFILGGGFSLYIFPTTIRVLERFGGGIVEFNYTLDKFVSYATGFIVSFGVVFQIPLVLFFLGKIGIVNYKLLASNRKFAALIAVVLGAIITPDPFTNLVASLPLYLLFEIGALLVRFSNPSQSDPI